MSDDPSRYCCTRGNCRRCRERARQKEQLAAAKREGAREALDKLHNSLAKYSGSDAYGAGIGDAIRMLLNERCAWSETAEPKEGE